METEKTSHETEKSLILSQISATQQTDPLLTKCQNGDPSQQFNGDTNWSHFKPNTVVYPMKSQQENCSGPANMQGILDQSMYEINGQMKHALSEQTFLDFHQPKKLCTDSEVNGNEGLRLWDNRDAGMENHLEGFPKHNKPGDFEIKHSKRNCNFPNGDLFLLSRNKQVPMPNGATTSLPSVKGTTGDLLEKTLSQYYPEHVSIAPQTNSSQVDQVTSNLPEQETPSPSLTSGFPISPQTSASEPLAKAPPEVQGSNGYNPEFTVNGYSSFVAKQKKPTYPLSDLPNMGTQLLSQEASESNVPSQTGINGCSQIREDREGLLNNSDCLSKSNQDFSRESYILPPVMAGAPSQNTQTGQQNLQIKVLQKQPTDESLHDNRDFSLPQQQILEPHIVDNRLTSQACTSASHNQHSKQKNKPKPDQEKTTSGNTDHSSQLKWIDLNSASAPQPSTDHPQMWDFFHPQIHMQQHTVTQSQSRCINSMSSYNFRSQNFSNPSCPSYENKAQDSYKNSLPPTQFPHDSVPECQQSNSGMHDHSKMQFNKHTSQQLCKNDQDQIQSQSFLSQPPPAEPQQQDNSTLPHQLPQDRQNMQAAPQSQDVSHSQVDAPLLKRLKTGCLHSESQKLSLGTETPAQTLSSPTIRENSTFPGSSKSNVQFLTKEAEALTERKLQQNMQYSQNTSKQHPNYQQPLQHRVHNHLEFPNSPISQSQLSQVSNSLQIPAQTFTKVEFQESFGQIQRESLPSQGAQGDLHAAMRTHLLQRQERQGPNNIRPSMPAIKSENCSGLETSAQHPPIEVQQQDQDKTKVMPVVVKQEHPSSSCEQSQQRSILATMEQQLKQYQLSPVFERKSLVNKSPNKMKVEMAGAVTVLSTSAEGNVKEQCKLQNFTPPKKIEPGLQTFLESPMKMLDTPIKNLLGTPLKTQYDISSCHCVDQISERDEGPYYTHLGSAPTVAGIRKIMEERSGLTGSAIRIEKVVYTGKEGKSGQGCPIAKWVIRRADVDEKLLVLVRERSGHSCETSCIVVVILIWEGIPINLADRLYSELSDTLTKHGALTNRRCALNEERTCACQGFEPDACGASFSFGCSWSMYYNGCKFARSKIPRKFKLLGDDPKEEEKLEQNLHGLATLIAPTYKKMAPDAYANQVEHEHRAPDCRLGQKEGRPFSGVTACLDFCAHAHRDLHNMPGGSTVVCTLTREDNRDIGKIPEDEQLHVLPLYKASSTDEFGSAEAQLEKTKTGAIQVLSAFCRQVRMLPEPAKSCRQKKLDAKRAAANKPNNPNTPNSKMDNTQQAKQKQATNENPGQNTTVTGPGNVRTNLDSGHLPHAHAAHQPQPQQQHQQQPQPNPNPSYTVPPFPRFSNASGTFLNSSKSATPRPQTPSSAGPYPYPLHAPNSYINVSNAPTPYPRSLTPNPLYTGYQCNGGLPMDNYHPYYSSNLKHPDMYHPQRNSLYSEQQYNAPQRYGVNYPPHYGEPSSPTNGYGTCNMKPGMHSIGRYPGYGPNMPPDAFSRPPSAHLHLDYAAIGKSSQFEAYPKPHMSQNPQMFPPNLNTLSMQNNKDLEINMHGANGISQVFPPLGTECFNPIQPPGLRLSSENALNPIVKQEPPTQTSEQKEKEDVWSDSEHNFLDSEIGGVAVAPSHGSIIIECAKRELHATTPLKKPDRNHPTRISLVFYQHKNLNEAKHGLALWETKMAEKAREKEEDAEKHGTENTSSKSSGKKVKREHSEPSEPSEPPYKQFLLMLNEWSTSCTTNTYVSTSPYAFTKVTGPYNQFL
ncbi:methylcytosine dioxygenase TET2 [Sinocyclocheilus anshuiensis]|uniref:Methylcytosine dioxygenase TET n=1 Tax=Sinocyclocheilus anshuiensis TaxID=1608454 RepID=A0A671K3Z9_9TELE|nr:PREDICTED: methylcytosine dioxygenase TET2-like [Sinocyclocheilus anshuiensis]XP_016350686.1 PREDICTED: methylcytosine dioxygenase TET2-like [Sinocyclocheilus anshuiensis]